MIINYEDSVPGKITKIQKSLTRIKRAVNIIEIQYIPGDNENLLKSDLNKIHKKLKLIEKYLNENLRILY